MNIICVVKLVPDVDSLVRNGENPVGTCKNARMMLNPDDACALACALRVKAGNPGCRVEVVTMGPESVRPHMEDLLRLSVDRGTLICDPVFEGSDGFVTSEVLARYISTRSFDCLLTGSRSLDKGNGQVPVHLAETLGLDQMSGIIWVDPDRFDSRRAVFKVADETSVTTYETALPSVLSLTRESCYKLPYVKLTDMRRDVSRELIVITNRDLGFCKTEVGHTGSPTKVLEIRPQTYDNKNRPILENDEKGIALVFDFLKRKGFL